MVWCSLIWLQILWSMLIYLIIKIRLYSALPFQKRKICSLRREDGFLLCASRILHTHNTYCRNILCSLKCYTKACRNCFRRQLIWDACFWKLCCHFMQRNLAKQETFHYQADKMKESNNKPGRQWIRRCQSSVIYHPSRIVWTPSDLR